MPLTVSASRADAVAWQVETLGATVLSWPPPPDAPLYDLILAGAFALPGEMPWTELDACLPALCGLLAPDGVLAFGLPGTPDGRARAAALCGTAPGWAHHPGVLDGGGDLYLVGGAGRDAATLSLADPD